jgi:hypothetical protein
MPSKAQRSDKYLKRDKYDERKEHLLYFCENIFVTGTLAIVRCAELLTIFDIFSGKLKNAYLIQPYNLQVMRQERKRIA